MRIALSTDDNHGLDAVLSYHFGRCPYYTFVDVEGTDIRDARSVPNPFYGSHGNPGEVPSFIKSNGAQVIIAGGMGARAIGFFKQFGIQAVTGISGRVREVLEEYINGKLSEAAPCNESRDHGVTSQGSILPPGQFEGDEVSRLKEEMMALRRQLAESQERLDKLEHKDK